MGLLNKVASKIIRIPARVAADINYRRFVRRDPLATQREMLSALLRKAAATRFGSDYAFAEMARMPLNEMYRCYSRRVPIRTYRQFWDDYLAEQLHDNGTGKQLILQNITWPGRIPYLCETSGTTAPTKFIPFSMEMFAANRRAALDLVSAYLSLRPDSRIAGSKFLYMAGSTALTSMGDGVFSGDMSAITLKNGPALLKIFARPGEPVSSAPWEQRLDGMARLLIRDKSIKTVSGVPPWLLLLFKRCEEISGLTAGECLSHLELLIHGGTSLAPYRDEFRRLFPDSPPQFLEVLPSSEAFMGFQVYGENSMRLTPWYGSFFEFVPIEQLDEKGVPNPYAEAVPLQEVEAGRRYAVILSTCSGLWRYHIGDTLKFLDTKQYRIEFTGRDRFLDRFEEKVTQHEVESAVASLNNIIGGKVREFMVGPDIENRRHLWVLACAESKEALRNTEKFLDRFLMDANADYASFRKQGRISPPRVLMADEQLIYRWSRDERGKLGGQSKIPHIDPTLTGEMVAALARYAGYSGDRVYSGDSILNFLN